MLNCAGDPMSSIGVFLCSNMAKFTSQLSLRAFVRVDFAVCTVFSATPLDCGYPGLDVMCSNPQVLANSAKSFEEYCGPLSDLTISGIPCHAKSVFILSIIAGLFVLVVLNISKNLL